MDKPCTSCASCRFALHLDGEDMRCYALPPDPKLPFVYAPPGDKRRPAVRMGDVSCIHYRARYPDGRPCVSNAGSP